VPKIKRSAARLHTIEGQPPVLSDLPEGCRFEARCPHAEARCRAAYPASFAVGAAHTARCWRLEPT
jgi:peptide/nickel transport system ATP-binding protein